MGKFEIRFHDFGEIAECLKCNDNLNEMRSRCWELILSFWCLSR
jgi:hypothetical protein